MSSVLIVAMLLLVCSVSLEEAAFFHRFVCSVTTTEYPLLNAEPLPPQGYCDRG